MNRSAQQLLLAGTLFASFVVAYSMRETEMAGKSTEISVVLPASPATPVLSIAPSDRTDLQLERLERDNLAEVTGIDPFPAKSWFVPPPPAPPAPSPKPSAPPLPYQYIGMKENANGSDFTVFLAKGNDSYTIKPGEKFDEVYLFEGIDNGSLVIRYLPLSTKQYLSLGPTE